MCKLDDIWSVHPFKYGESKDSIISEKSPDWTMDICFQNYVWFRSGSVRDFIFFTSAHSDVKIESLLNSN